MTATLTAPPSMSTDDTPRLRPEIKQEWVSRLRSGNYPQGEGRLKNADGYCCLGVLSEMAAEAGVVRFELIPDSTTYALRTDNVWIDAWTNSAVAEWAFETNPEAGGSWQVVHPEGGGSTLAWMNDNGTTFPEIADIIEEQF